MIILAKGSSALQNESLRELIDTPMPPGPTWAVAEAVEAHLGRALQSRGVLRSLSSG